jgi:hypothetical protein
MVERDSVGGERGEGGGDLTTPGGCCKWYKTIYADFHPYLIYLYIYLQCLFCILDTSTGPQARRKAAAGCDGGKGISSRAGGSRRGAWWR